MILSRGGKKMVRYLEGTRTTWYQGDAENTKHHKQFVKYLMS